MPFTHEQVPWKTLERFGVTPEKLQQSGDYDRLLAGQRTKVLYTNTFDGAGKFEQGKFFLIHSKGGPMVMYDGVKAATFIPNEVKGYHFTPEDKDIINRQGHLGKTVDMVNKKGEVTPHYVSVDKDTKTMLTWDSSRFREPKEILGVPLSKDQQQLLRAGKPVFVAGMKDKAGQEFSAYLVPDAAKKGLGFVPKERILEQFLAPEHKVQVARNNQGKTTEETKNVAGPLKSKQTKEQEGDTLKVKALRKGRSKGV